MLVPVLSALTPVPVPPLRAQEPIPAACAVRELERRPVRLDDGTHVYVEPRDLVERDGRFLLAGTPTYETPPGEVGPGAKHIANGIAGVMLGPDARAVRVPWPVEDRHLKVLRSAADPAGGWLVLFGELDAAPRIPETGRLIGLWYARWDGGGWAQVEAVPMPPRPGTGFANPASVVARGSGFVWALPYEGDSREDRGAQVLHREGGTWRWEVIGSRRGLYVELWERDGRLSAALVTPPPDSGRDRNSLVLYERDPEWRAEELLVRGLDDLVFRPHAVRSGDRVVLSWLSYLDPDWRMQAYLDVPADTTQIVTIDPSMSRGDVFRLAADRVVWATEHVAPDDTRTLRFADDFGGRVRSLGELPSPYTGHFAAERGGADTLLLAGPRLSKDPAEVTLVSLILRLKIDCDGS